MIRDGACAQHIYILHKHVCACLGVWAVGSLWRGFLRLGTGTIRPAQIRFTVIHRCTAHTLCFLSYYQPPVYITQHYIWSRHCIHAVSTYLTRLRTKMSDLSEGEPYVTHISCPHTTSQLTSRPSSYSKLDYYTSAALQEILPKEIVLSYDVCCQFAASSMQSYAVSFSCLVILDLRGLTRWTLLIVRLVHLSQVLISRQLDQSRMLISRLLDQSCEKSDVWSRKHNISQFKHQ